MLQMLAACSLKRDRSLEDTYARACKSERCSSIAETSSGILRCEIISKRSSGRGPSGSVVAVGREDIAITMLLYFITTLS